MQNNSLMLIFADVMDAFRRGIVRFVSALACRDEWCLAITPYVEVTMRQRC